MASLNLDVTNFGTSYVNQMQVRTIGNSESTGQNAYGLSIYAGPSQNLYMTVGATYSVNVTGDKRLVIGGNSVLQLTGNESASISGNASKSVTGSLTSKADGAYSVGSTSAAVSVSAGTSVSVVAGSTAALSAVSSLALSSASYTLNTSAGSEETIGASKTVSVGATYGLTVTNACSIASTGQLSLTTSSFLSASALTSVDVLAGTSMDLAAGTSGSFKAGNGALALGSTGGALSAVAVGGEVKIDSMSHQINIGTENVNQDINIGTSGQRSINIGTTGGNVTIVPNFTVGGSLTINGDLNIKGQTNQYSIESLLVADKVIKLNDGLNDDVTANGGGLSLSGTSQHSWLWQSNAGVNGTNIWESNDSSVNVPTGQLFQIDRKKALSQSALFVATKTADGGIYMNGPDAAVTGDWRLRQATSNGVEVLLFERYDGAEWVSRFRMN